jgi:hypothetical protein
MTFILPSFGASAISAVPASGGGGGGSWSGNTYSVDFDGTDDYVTMGAPSSLDITGDMTLSIWVNTNQNTQYTALFSKRNGSGRQFYFYLRNDSGNKNLSLQTEPPGGSLSSMNTSGNPVTLNTWHHVAAVINSGTTNGTTIYVDGTAVGTGTMTLASNSTAPFIIGSSTGTGNFFDGKLDEAAIFNSALSASQITNIYRGEDDGGSGGTNGVPGDLNTFNPIGWWRMGDNDSGTGTTVTDQGSGGNDGTLTNSPTFVQGVPSVPAAYSNTYSLDFDGTDDYLATTYQYGSATQFTYSFWIKTTDTGNSHWIGNSLSGGYDTRCHFGTKGGAYFITLGNSSAQYAVGNAGSASAVTDGNWHHMVFQWDGTNTNGVNLYVDGNTTPVFTYTSNRASNASTAALKWGIGWGGAFWAYDGLMDEAALFESILSTSDITTLYNSGVPGDISSLNPVGWWRMGDNDGGTGTTITDQGSGGNDGTLTNGPTFSTDVPT